MRPRTIIFRPASGKLPTFVPLGIVRRSCSSEGFWETDHLNEFPGRAPSRAFRNPAHAGAAIRDWPASRGLCSSRAIEVLWQELPATSLSSCAIFAPADRSNFWGCPSLPVTVTPTNQKPVFTQTQMRHAIVTFACLQLTGRSNIHFYEGRQSSRANRRHEAMPKGFGRLQWILVSTRFTRSTSKN